MLTPASLAGGVVGAGLIMATGTSVVATLVVPRRSRDRLGRALDGAVDAVFRAATRRTRRFVDRDRRLAGQAPALILLQLAVWLIGFEIGFALLLWPLDSVGLGHAATQAGSSLFTLGYSAPQGTRTTVVDYVAAATGLVVVALQIGYLPTLYGAFNRREVEVMLLTSRAGVPAWGPEILARTRYGFGADDDGVVMDAFYLQWERWAADVAESHTNYPVLTRFRSPYALSSWLVGLVAVLDSAALWMALAPSSSPRVECRLCLRMGFSALQAIGRAVGLEVDSDPDPDAPLALTEAEYLEGVARVLAAGFKVERSAEQAYPDFRGWRANYEAVALALAWRTDAVPAPWTGPRRTLDASVEPLRPPNRTPSPYVPKQ